MFYETQIRFAARFGGGGAPKATKIPPPPPPAPPAIDEDALAKQRKSLEAKRVGRNSLRIDPGAASNINSTGLGLPQ